MKWELMTDLEHKSWIYINDADVEYEVDSDIIHEVDGVGLTKINLDQWNELKIEEGQVACETIDSIQNNEKKPANMITYANAVNFKKLVISKKNVIKQYQKK